MPALEPIQTEIAGVYELTRMIHRDPRGSFERIFDLALLSQMIGRVSQVNRAVTTGVGTIRGIHLQLPPAAETKVVSCVRGSIFDVAVDLRADSPTFGQWVGRTLTAGDGSGLVIPPGCGHALQVLEDPSEVIYVHSAEYATESEVGLHPENAEVGIMWPLTVSGLSERDAREDRSLAFFREVRW